MRNIILLGFICLTFFACPLNQPPDSTNKLTSSTHAPTFSNVIKIPKGYKKLVEVNGDLDKDDIEEKVFVFDTPEEGDLGTIREVRIYLKGLKGWKLWYKARNAVLSSQHGGVMGDPFQDLKIERGCIVINHFGGSRQKWTYTHRYRYQKGDWKLIGTTAVSNDPCKEVETFDYNLSSGNVNYQKAYENCETAAPTITGTTKETFVYKRSFLPNMGQFSFEKIYAISPKTGKCVPEVACFNYKAKKKGTNGLSGVYTLGGHDESWVLLLQPKNNQLEVTFIEIDGMLPPDNQLPVFIKNNKGRVLHQFEIDFSTNTFQSDLGHGLFSNSSNRESVTFLEKESHIDDKLTLTKKHSLDYLIE